MKIRTMTLFRKGYTNMIPRWQYAHKIEPQPKENSRVGYNFVDVLYGRAYVS